METPKWKKIAILVFGLLENLIFSGTIFGWSALNYMLKNEHIYEYVCDNVIIPHIPLINDSYTNYSLTNDHNIDDSDSTTNYYDNFFVLDEISNSTNETLLDKLNEFESPPNFSPKYQSHGCAAQDKILNLAYTIGTFCMGFTAFIWGFLLDKWGLRIVRLFINVLITGGTVLLALTDKDKSYLLFPAITLLSLAGVPLRIANMQFADLFPRNRSTVITFYSGAFSASAIVFVLLKYLYDFGMSYSMVSTILVITSLLMIPFTFLLLPSDRIKEETDNDSKLNLFQGKSMSSNLSIISPVTLENYTILSSPDLMRRHIFNISETINNKPNTYSNKMFSKKADSESSFTINTINSSNNSTNIPLKISVLSWSFTLHQWWYSWLITYMVMYVGSMNLWLDRITQDSQTMGDYVKIFGIVQVLALILAPISGVFMDYSVSQADKETDPFKRKLLRVQAGFWPTFITSLTLAATLVCRFFDKQIAIIISIVFITLLRSFLIAVASAYLRIRFHSQHFNKLLGIMSSTGALVTLLQFPLFVWESYSPSNAVWVNVFNCVCTIVAFLNPLYLLITPLQKHLLLKEEQEEADAKSR